jgi:protein TonB
MKRLVVAALMALAIHGLVFAWSPKGPRSPSVPIIRQEAMALFLTSPAPKARTPEKPEVQPEVLPPLMPETKKPSPRRQESKVPIIPRKESVRIPERASDVIQPSPSVSHDPETLLLQESTGIPKAAALPSDTPPTETHLPGPPGAGGATTAPSPVLKEAIPIYRSNPAPEYPAVARRRGYEGTVVLEVLVNRDGKVADLRLFQSSGHASLDQTALSSVKGWVFEPARRGDAPVEMWVRIPVCFRLKEGGTPTP